MLKLGIIGTGAISHEFITAAHLSGQYQLQAIYSRRLETAKQFAQPYEQPSLYTSIEHFLKSDIDLVYIASPNSLHFQQAKQALQHKKHVIIEKPAVSHPQQWKELVALAHSQDVYVFEAARNYHEEAFNTIQDFLNEKDILGAHFTYAKYSSKMPDLLAGKEPNVFSSKFAGGALMDLGIYTIYAAVKLFGQPINASYQAQQLSNSIDLNGSGQLEYPSFFVHIFTGKNIQSQLLAEIYTSDGTLTLNGIERVQSAVFRSHDGSITEIKLQVAPHQMLEEALFFAQTIQNRWTETYSQTLMDSQIVHNTIYAMRKDAGILFEEETHA